MAEGHWQLGDGVDFPFSSREDGGGERLAPPLPASQVRGEGRDASPDKRQRENTTSPACRVTASSPGLCGKPVVPAPSWPGSPLQSCSPWFLQTEAFSLDSRGEHLLAGVRAWETFLPFHCSPLLFVSPAPSLLFSLLFPQHPPSFGSPLPLSPFSPGPSSSPMLGLLSP